MGTAEHRGYSYYSDRSSDDVPCLHCHLRTGSVISVPIHCCKTFHEVGLCEVGRPPDWGSFTIGYEVVCACERIGSIEV